MAEKKDEIPSNEENRDHNSPAENQNGQRRIGESEIFTYDDLENATKYFVEDCILGGGSFGTVYKGQLETGQVHFNTKKLQIVAVKKRKHDSEQGDKEFLKEVIMLSVLRHPNIINLIGFSAESPKQRLLVYEFMPLRSLHDCLNDMETDSKLSYWKTRMKIALGTAKALNYLHNEAKPPVVFNGLKSADILLDQSFHPKLSDFGIAEFDPTPPPDNAFSKEEYFVLMTKKYDVYNFGIVLFELITGRTKNKNEGQNQEPFDWLNDKLKEGKLEEAVDPELDRKDELTSLDKAVDVALACLHPNHLIRRNMADVERALKNIVDDLDKFYKRQRGIDHATV